MRRPLYGWLVSDAISLTGTRISMLALPLFVLLETGSVTKTGMVALAETLPMVVCKVLGGPLIDRVGARRVAITCDIASFFVVGMIPLLHHAGLLSFPLFLALVAVAGALRGPGDGAKHALIPALVDQAGVPMERATGLSATIERTSGMIGAGVAGVLVAAFGAANALVVDAVSFGVAAGVLAWATGALDDDAPVEVQVTDPAPCAAQLREGWDYLRRDPILLGISVMVALTNLLDIAYASVLMPVWAVDSGNGAAVLGLLFAVFSGASALGAICAAAWAARLSRHHTYLIAFLLCGAPRFAVMALDVPLAAVVAVFVIGGFSSGFINPVLGAVIFERIPSPLVGRVSSLTTAMCYALMPFGGLLASGLIAVDGLVFALVCCGAAYFVVTMLPAVDPRWREMDRLPAPAPVSP